MATVSTKLPMWAIFLIIGVIALAAVLFVTFFVKEDRDPVTGKVTKSIGWAGASASQTKTAPK